MMKRMLQIVAGAGVVICIYFFVLGYMSKSGRAEGLVDGKLALCPDKPNCVCSEFKTDGAHYVPAFDFSGKSPQKIWRLLQEAIRQSGGGIVTLGENYLAAEYRIAMFGFVDDLECRLDTVDFKVHLRSASRVGHSDLGVNKKRVEKVVQLLQQKLADE